ncbi:MAG: tetratricopeptide repeat protein [Planctomycetota bacterium]
MIGFFWVVVISVTMMTGYKLLAGGEPEPEASGPQDESAALERQVADLEAKLQANPKDVHALISLGDTYLQLRDAHKALSALEKAESLAPDDAHVQSDLGTLYQQMGQYGKALEKFTKAVEADPGRLGLLLHIAMIHRTQGNADKAREVLQTLLGKNPEPRVAEMARRLLSGIDAEDGAR